MSKEALSGWRSIDTAPDNEGEMHLRGVWVFCINQHGEKYPAYFQADCGYLNESGDFLSTDGDDFGWAAEDYDWWAPIPDETPEPPALIAEGE